MRIVVIVLMIVLALAATSLIAFIVAKHDQLSTHARDTVPRSVREPDAHPPKPPTTPLDATRPSQKSPALESATDERSRLDKVVWATEVKAQEYEEAFVALWDAMRAKGEDQHELLATFPFTELLIKHFGAPESHRWVEIARMDGAAKPLDQRAWLDLVSGFARDGYRLKYVEFHHSAFDLEPSGVARSKMSLKLFIIHPQRKERHVISGSLRVLWSDAVDAKGMHIARSIDATEMTLTSRTGDDAFAEEFVTIPEKHTAPFQSALEPTLVYDLDGDGKDDIVLPRWNKVYINQGSSGHVAFDLRPLAAHPLVEVPGGLLITTGVLADVTGDGNVDLVLAGIDLPPMLFEGGPGGTFPTAPHPIVDLPKEAFRLPMGMTAGDVDGDGRADLWIGQYRRPFDDASMPNPYWDANDGYPSFLLINNGDGTFRDATAAAGLSAKRHRRNYSASFVDLDDDGRLDLVTVNDFSGVDIFRNLGKGVFADATDETVDQRHSYGMSHAFADFNGDGRLDLFVAGMGSTTARRLEYMKLGRADFPEHQKMRMPMGYGNRMYLGGADHRYQQAPFNDQVARTGWSWGCTALDVDNTGNIDLFVNNGFMSRKTAKDYCSRWWTHDIYQASEPAKPDMLATVMNELEQGSGSSWNGFEHKALLMNEGGTSFIDTAFAMNLAYEWDARAAVSADFDGDGMVDVMTVNSQYNSAFLPIDPVLRVFRNQMPNTNHWIGVRLREEPGHCAMGAKITVRAGGREHVAVLVSGDSFRCQHPLCKHVGLGLAASVDAVEVRWIDGAKRVIEHPAIDRELTISAGPDAPPAATSTDR